MRAPFALPTLGRWPPRRRPDDREPPPAPGTGPTGTPALLAISVVIAVVGIANTLSLSVIERTRESALLRALGLTRGQLRLMLAVEAVLLPLVGTLLGAAPGAGYAWVGVNPLLGEFTTAPLVLPWSQLAVVVAAD